MIKRLALLALVCLSLPEVTIAQTRSKEEIPVNDVKPNIALEAANELYDRGEYYSALPIYEKAYAKERVRAVKADIEFKIGDCYRSYGDYKSAEEWYSKAVKSGYDRPIVLLWLAECQRAAGAYSDALANYKEYRNVVPDDVRAYNGILSCEKARDMIANPTKIIVENLEAVNTKYSDFAPVSTRKNPNYLVFTSGRSEATGQRDDGWTGQKYTDLFESVRDARGRWSTPRVMAGEVNTDNNEGAAVLDRRGNTLLFTRCLPALTVNNVTCDIFLAKRNGSIWSKPTRLAILPDSITIGHPTLSPDEYAVFFTAIMPEGFGGRDIYVSVFNPDLKKWGKPMNLGPKVNTPGDEMYPYMSDDSTLYFASNGLVGMGGLDIFKVKYRGNRMFTTYNNPGATVGGDGNEEEAIYKLTDTTLTMRPGEFAARPEGTNLDGEAAAAAGMPAPVDSVAILCQMWSDSENMGYPMNSNADDFGLYLEPGSPERGFFSSARDGGKGGDDIYAFRIPALEFTIQGKVIDVDTKTAIKNASVELVGSDGSIVSVKTDKKGNYIFDKSMVKPNTVYKISASYDNFLIAKGVQSTVGLTQNTDLYQDAFLMRSTLKPIGLPNIFYDLDRATLRPESQNSLDTLTQQLKDNDRLVIKINSYTDSRGDDKYNLDLSQRRSQSVVDYLIRRGIDPARLIAQGFGETKPLITDTEIAKLPSPEAQETAFQRNRRTEFEVVRSDYVPRINFGQVIKDSTSGKNIRVNRPIASEPEKEIKVKGNVAKPGQPKTKVKTTIKPEEIIRKKEDLPATTPDSEKAKTDSTQNN